MQWLRVAEQAGPAPGLCQLDVVGAEVLLETFPAESSWAGGAGEEFPLLAAPGAEQAGLAGPVLLLVEL